jgi:alpha-mannosidase
VPDAASVIEGHVARVLYEFVRPAVHGPSAGLDDIVAHHVAGEPIPVAEAMRADYSPFAVGDAWGPRWGTTWFRLRGRVPKGWAGHEVVLRFEVGGAGETGFGAEALVWQDRRPLQGLSPNHTEVPITTAAAGGESMELYVEAAANPRPPFGAPTWPDLLPDPGGAAQFTLARAELAVVDPDLRTFWHDARIVFETLASLPRNDPVRRRYRDALEAACRVLDLDDVRGTFRAAGQVLAAAWEEPAERVVRHRVSAVGHAHLDTAWLWPLRETVRKCARTFSTAVRLMGEYPEYRFACSQAVHLQWMKDEYPDLWIAVREQVAAGRFVPTGCMWVEPDCNLPSGESLVRQVIYGKRFYLDEFGIEARGAWLPDTFGFTPALPQILRRAGVDWFFTQKLSWNQYNEMPHHSFVWEGIDGSRVFTHFPPTNTYAGNATPNELIEGVRRFKDADLTRRSLYPFGHGDGGGGPTAEMLESLRRLRGLDGLPDIELEGPEQFFAAAAAEPVDWPVWSGELYLELHRGTYTTHADVKRDNRRAEGSLHDAELWATIVSGGEDEYPAAGLESAWKTLLVQQFHDIIPGSGIRWVYEDANRHHAAVLETTERITRGALDRLAGEVDTSGRRRPIVVFNAASHDRVGLVALDVAADEAPTLVVRGADGDGSPLQVAPDGSVLAQVWAPACGYAVCDVTSRSHVAPSGLHVDAGRLENERLRVVVDSDGLLSSIYDKTADREVVAPGRSANLLQLHPDYPNFFDAWDIDRFAFDQVTDLTTLDDLAVLERGPLRVSLRLRRSFGQSSITQRITLTRDSPVLEFETDVDWRESHKLLKVAFPVAVETPTATYEIQFGHLTRPTRPSTSWELAKFEAWGHQWVDLSDENYGVALLNDSKYGYDVLDNVLRLSLLRAPTWPDPMADRGAHHFTYAVVPHRGDLRAGAVVEHARDLNGSLRAVPARSHPGRRPSAASLVTVGQPGVLIEAVKAADRAPGVVVRLAEVWGRQTRVQLRLWDVIERAHRADLLERDLERLPVHEGTVPLTIEPFELTTVRLELAGAR